MVVVMVEMWAVAKGFLRVASKAVHSVDKKVEMRAALLVGVMVVLMVGQMAA